MPHSMLCVVCGPFGGADVIQNILLFLPLGVGLGMLRVSSCRGIGLIVVTTAAVELLQATVLGGRFASLGDILANSAGGTLGLWVGRRDDHWAFPRPRTRTFLARGAVAIMLLVLVGATASMRRVVPSGPLALVIAPLEAHGTRFEGSVSAASLGGEAVAPGRLPHPVEAAFRQSGGSLRARVVSGPWVEYESTIAAVMDREWRGFVRISQDGRDAVLGVYVAGNRAGLRGPRLVLPAVLPAREGDTVVIEARVARPGLALTVRSEDTIATRSLDLGPSTAWMVLFPFAYGTSTVVAIVSLLWLVVLTIPAGYWSGLTRARTEIQHAPLAESRVPGREVGVNLLGVAIYTVIGLGIAPLVLGLAPAPALHWLAPLLGFALGATAARLASRVAS